MAAEQEEKTEANRERECEEREAGEGVEGARRGLEHTARDLEGVNVVHALEDFDEAGGEQILTLKDATIDQNEEGGDELENMEMREKEALSEKMSLKKKRPVYDPHAEAEEGGSKILEHYDETIDGKKRKRFQFAEQGVSAEDREAMKRAVGEKLKKQAISLDVLKDNVPISDYAEAVEAKIRKPKKKKAKNTRQKTADEDDIFPAEQTDGTHTNGDTMDVDTVDGRQRPSKEKPEESFADDDDLQASLAIQRRAALKKKRRNKPEDIARQLREEASATPGGDAEEETAEEGGLVIDETTEFVANLQRAKEEEDSQPKRPKARSLSPVKQEGSPPDVDMKDTPHSPSPYPDVPETTKQPTSTLTETGLSDDVTLTNGLGATLGMLSKRGLLQPNTEDGDIVFLHRDRERFKHEKQRREAELELKARQQRERDRQSGRLASMSAREREEYARQENRQRETLESRGAG